MEFVGPQIRTLRCSPRHVLKNAIALAAVDDDGINTSHAAGRGPVEAKVGVTQG